MTNYQVMCEKCNLKKQNREITLEELKKEIKKN
jgi:5-methylcytosine-specific restriction endonuclease McrA